MRKNLRHLRNLRDKLIFSEKKKPAEKKKIRGKKNKKASEIFRNLRLFIERRRRPTLPHCIAVPSAQVGLTSLFGMGRGGTPPQQPPKISFILFFKHNDYRTQAITVQWNTATEAQLSAKAFGQLVVLGFDIAVFTPAPYQRHRL